MKPIQEIFRKKKANKTTSSKDSSLNAVETKEEYIARLGKAIKNLEEGKGIILSEQELDRHFEELLKK